MMFIFSSTHYDLFKQNILNACCYPVGHLMRVRYEEKYLQTCLRVRPKDSLVGKSGVFVFAEGAKENKRAWRSPGSRLPNYLFNSTMQDSGSPKRRGHNHPGPRTSAISRLLRRQCP